jgi:hypothetical protein
MHVAHGPSVRPVPCPGRNLGLGRETSPPPGPYLARATVAVHLDRTVIRSLRRNKTPDGHLPLNPNSFSPSPFSQPHGSRSGGSGGGHGGHRRRGQKPPDQVWLLPILLSLPSSILLSAPHRAASDGRPQPPEEEDGAAVGPLAGERTHVRVSAPPSSGLTTVPGARAS